MTRRRYTPEELERLVSLPEDHPERRTARSAPEFEAYRMMLAEFDRPSDALVPDAEIAAVQAELANRLADTGLLGTPAAGAATTPGAARGMPPARRPGFRAWLIRGEGRTALAFACAAIVVVAAWWATQRTGGPGRLRGVAEPGAFVLEARPERGGIVLSWPGVPGADAYRVVFLDAGLAEAGYREVGRDTSVTLSAGMLPAGVATGSRVSLEVVAMRMGAQIATTPARSILLP
jgi:hypothetical protein